MFLMKNTLGIVKYIENEITRLDLDTLTILTNPFHQLRINFCGIALILIEKYTFNHL